MDRSVFLIGYMCSGKTTLGRALASVMGMPFVDLDEYIEAEAGMCVADIFKAEGEAGFRSREEKALRSVAASAPAVVACGGGTPCRPGLMEAMNAAGITVYLHPCKQRLLTRLMEGRSKRPLLAAVSDEESMWQLASSMIEQRHPHYSKAQILFDSSWLESEEEISLSAMKLAAIVSDYGNN